MERKSNESKELERKTPCLREGEGKSNSPGDGVKNKTFSADLIKAISREFETALSVKGYAAARARKVYYKNGGGIIL